METFPWTRAMEEKKPQTGIGLALDQSEGLLKKFIVNSSPILEENGTLRGVLSSFDDVSELELANNHLINLVKELEASKSTVQSQNEELEWLAARDPLTGCLNRRSFFDQAKAAFETAQKKKADLACIMVDIDQFKLFNDRMGHAIGDQVLNVVARTLSANVRPADILSRYGGEEFCIFLPGLDVDQASRIAERLRRRIMAESGLAMRTTVGIRITASFGVSALSFGATDSLALIDQSDKALYAAKQDGRNRVVSWDQMTPTSPSHKTVDLSGVSNKNPILNTVP